MYAALAAVLAVSVAADEEVVELVERLAGVARLGERALRLRVRRSVRPRVMYERMHGAAQHLLR